jgi:hypothetical protein
MPRSPTRTASLQTTTGMMRRMLWRLFAAIAHEYPHHMTTFQKVADRRRAIETNSSALDELGIGNFGSHPPKWASNQVQEYWQAIHDWASGLNLEKLDWAYSIAEAAASHMAYLGGSFEAVCAFEIEAKKLEAEIVLLDALFHPKPELEKIPEPPSFAFQSFDPTRQSVDQFLKDELARFDQFQDQALENLKQHIKAARSAYENAGYQNLPRKTQLEKHLRWASWWLVESLSAQKIMLRETDIDGKGVSVSTVHEALLGNPRKKKIGMLLRCGIDVSAEKT